MSSVSPSAWWFHNATCYAGAGFEAFAQGAVPSGAPRLPEPTLPPSLNELLELRVSCRTFSPQPLSIADLGALLHAGYGVVGKAIANGVEFDHRPVPSAGAHYPLQIFVLARSVADADPGAYHYDPLGHRLTPVGARPDDATTATLFLDQPYVAEASAIIVIAAELGRILGRYPERGYRYVLFEAGHAGQNIALCAAAIGVGNLNIGGFLDGQLGALLHIDSAAVVPLYAAAVGYPGREDPSQIRSIE